MKGYNLDNSIKVKMQNQFNNEFGLSFVADNKEEVERMKPYNIYKHKYTECMKK